MLDWLDRFFSSAAADIGSAVSNAIHWAVHALAAVVFAVFRLVGNAWGALADAVVAFHVSVDHWATEVLRFATYVVRVLIPRVVKWAETELGKLATRLAQLYDALQRAINDLIGRIAAAVRSLTDWVLREVYDPLKKYADLIWADLLKWGYTAFWWVTHPDQLAEALIFPIANSLEKHAWELAGRLGTFVLSLVARNIPRLITLIETILEAVI